MKKKIIFLSDYPFTNFASYVFELDALRKNEIDISIHDLSYLIYGKKFIKSWKTLTKNNSIKFFSLLDWIIFFFKNLKPKRREIVYWSNIKTFNFNSFIIELILRIFTKKIIFNSFYDLYTKEDKKNFLYIIKRIIYNKFNFSLYFFIFKKVFFNFFLKFFKYNNLIALTNNSKVSKKLISSAKKITYLDFNSYDYSNFILYKKKLNKHKKKYAIYIDSGGPYFDGDRLLNNGKKNYDEFKYYDKLNFFFKSIENFFKLDILIIPHPKYKSKKKSSINPYFDKKKTIYDYDALPKFSEKCDFFINYNSTAQSYAVISNKPTILFYSSKYILESPGNILSRKRLSSKIKSVPVDICNFDMEDIRKNLKINFKAYENYKYNFLTPKNKKIENVTNSQILKKILLGNIL